MKQKERYEAAKQMYAAAGVDISIPKIGENIAIYHTSCEEVLQKGAGHIMGSSLPVGGASTHAALAAHRGLP